MDGNKDKSIIEKFTDTVKDVVETAANAAKEALEPEPVKLPDGQLAYISSTPMTEPTMPPFVVIPRHTNAPPKVAAKTSRIKKTAKKVVKKSKTKKSKKAAAKKTAKKSTKKKSEKSKRG
jgi:hypothetical protein